MEGPQTEFEHSKSRARHRLTANEPATGLNAGPEYEEQRHAELELLRAQSPADPSLGLEAVSGAPRRHKQTIVPEGERFRQIVG